MARTRRQSRGRQIPQRLARDSFTTLANALPVLVFVSDTVGEAIFFNDRFQSFTGLDSPTLLGGAFPLAIHEADREQARAAWRQAVAAEEPYEVEFRLRGADGAYVWFLFRGAPARSNGVVDHWVCTGTDIDDRKLRSAHEAERQRLTMKAAEQALRDSRAHLQRIVDSGIIGVGKGTRDGRIAEVNDAFLKMIGQTREAFAAGAISWRDLTAPEYAERDEAALAQLAREGFCKPYEKEYVLPGRRLPVQIAMASLEGAGPDVDHIALIIDLSGVKAAEAALRASHRALEQKLAERTAELRELNGQLNRETKRRVAIQNTLLKSQNLEALGQLTSSVAHDFNNILMAVLGGFSLIQARTREPSLIRLATEGVKAAERGAALVRKLMRFAKQQNVVLQPVALAPLFDELAPQLRHVAGYAIEVAIGDAGAMPAVAIDPAQLQAAITNLAANARDAMPGGGALTIAFETIAADALDKPTELGDSDAVAIHVRDTGEGMAPEVLQRVLEPFFTTKSPDRGTGLGLAMVHGLMLQSGGALRMTSALGQGTTVSLYLPALEDAAERPVEAAPPDLRAHVGGRVLLVEDDDLVRDVVKAQLDDWGYSVVLADSAHAAMETIRDGAPLALAITDHALAGSNGVKLLERLRAVRPALPVLFITGMAEPPGLEGETVLLKPFSTEVFSAALLDLLEGARARAEAEGLLDRLAARFKSPRLVSPFVAWRETRGARAYPGLAAVLARLQDLSCVATVAVDQTRVPMTFERVTVGAELARRAERDLVGARLSVTGDDRETTLEGAYRQCVRSGRPTYAFARFDFGESGRASMERLLLPCAEDGVTIDGLISVVFFDDGAAQRP